MNRKIALGIALCMMISACVPGQQDPASAEDAKDGKGAKKHYKKVSEDGAATAQLSTGGSVTVKYFRRGLNNDKPAILVLDGPRCMEWFGRHLEPDNQLVYFNIPEKVYLLSDRVAVVEAVRAKLGLKKVIPMGLSLNATVAIEYIIAHKRHAGGAIWVSGISDYQERIRKGYQAMLTRVYPGSPEQHFLERMLAKEKYGVADAVAAATSTIHTPICNDPKACTAALKRAEAATKKLGIGSADSDSVFRELPIERQADVLTKPDVRGKSLLEYSTADAGKSLPKVPVLLIQGSKDTTTYLESAVLLAAELPDSSLVVLDNSYHLPYADESEAFIKALKTFVKQSTSQKPEPSALGAKWKFETDETDEALQKTLLDARNQPLLDNRTKVCKLLKNVQIKKGKKGKRKKGRKGNTDSDTTPRDPIAEMLGVDDIKGFKNMFCRPKSESAME